MGRGRHALARLPGLAVLLVANAALAQGTAYLVSARAEVRTRNLQPGSLGAVTNEVELRPVAGLLWGGDATRLGVSYQPVLLLRDPFALGPVGLLHRALLAFSQRGALAAFRLDLDGSWGITDVSALRPADTATPGSIETRTLGLVPYVRTWGRLGVDVTLTRRTALSLDGGYQLSGSPEDLSLPIQHGPFATTRFTWRPDARNTFTTTVLGAHAEYFTDPTLVQLAPVPDPLPPEGLDERPIVRTHRSTLVQGTQAFDHSFDSRTSLGVAAGVAWTREQVWYITRVGLTQDTNITESLFRELLPVASATVSHRLVAGGALELRATARLGPFSDRFTGNIYERLEALAQVRWRPTRLVEATGTGGGGWAVNIGRAEQVGDRIVYGDARVTWTPAPWLAVQGDARLAWSEQPSYGIPGGLQWLVGVAATVLDKGAL